jgi:hypothetical protein
MAINLIDLYDTYSMIEAINKLPTQSSFLRDTFFPNRRFSPTEHVQFDFAKEGRYLAPFYDRNSNPALAERQGFETRDFVAPPFGVTRVLTVDDIVRRWIGEAPYTSRTPVERGAEILKLDLLKSDLQCSRTEEYFAATTILYGTISGQIATPNGMINATPIDWKSQLGQTINNISVTWTNAGDPFGDLATLFLEIQQQSLVVPNIVVMDNTAFGLLRKNPELQKELYSFRGDSGNTIAVIAPDRLSDNVSYAGRLRYPAIDLYIYNEWYLNNNNVSTPFLPPGTVIMGNTKSNNILYYGAITLWQGDPVDGAFSTYTDTPRVPKVYADIKNNRRYLEMHARALTCPTDLTEWGVLTVS